MQRWRGMACDGDDDEAEAASNKARNGAGSCRLLGQSSFAVWSAIMGSRIEIEKLQQFEDEAKREKIGAWGANAGRLNARAQRPSAFSSFVADGKVESRSMPPASSAIFPIAKPAASITRSSPVGTNGSHAKEKIPLGNIEINSATEKELTTVPGIGHVMAARIIAARPFRSADDLKRVSGIGEKKYAQIRPYFQ